MSESVHPSVVPLFQPLSIGRMQLPNRIVMAPMTRQRSPGGVPGQAVVDYYRRRAEGGVGLVITEGSYIDHAGANAFADGPDFFGESALAGWRRVVEAVHGVGGRIAAQLWHCGPERRPGMPHDPAVPGFGPVEIRDARGKLLVKAMTMDDIADVVASYARAAAHAESLGFDGVEIHAAHEFLFDTFLWARSNTRTDAYGGTLEKRLRLTLEVVQAVRQAVSADFPVLLRFSQFKRSDYAARIAETPDELGRLLKPLAEAGVDAFHASTRRFGEPAFDGSPLSLAGWARQLTGKPAIAVGSIGLHGDVGEAAGAESSTPADLQGVVEQLAHSEFDLIAVGRALLADPGWASKVRQGRFDELRGYDAAILDRTLF
ncbi:1,2-oxophytodienoate reductase [Xanthomonas citri pv. aurantifolii]|nr:NADH:flavin oxidoreductase [Xanthomonas citri]AMV05969.1 1,2-oxophytodienoate reductase [Xanthomonas citri pv. aurantifolii]ARE58087.1 1,2-oxophytodienoate reductase [Xanthomonas citri pv. aurantifolii]EFF42901.1 oxidoreductase, FAD/FMN-binding [Xanthomonas citri pv. aurantifolii str. ICPB 11122]